MATDISSIVRVLGGYKEDQHRTVGNESSREKSKVLITRDLLGGSSKFVESQELDLDLQVPTGWEKRLDLKSGKIYIQKCNALSSPSKASISEHKNQTSPTDSNLQDLNFPPSPSKVPLSLFEDTNLELKLVSSSFPSSNYQSVCTLDKVKLALERAEREPVKKRMVWKSTFSSASPSYSSSSSSIRESQEDENEDKLLSSPIAAGCPGCLSYILIMKNNPKCPRCSSVVPFPLKKKPKIDLNMSI